MTKFHNFLTPQKVSSIFQTAVLMNLELRAFVNRLFSSEFVKSHLLLLLKNTFENCYVLLFLPPRNSDKISFSAETGRP